MQRNSFEEHVIHGTADFPVGIYDTFFEEERGIVFPDHYHKEFELLFATDGKLRIQLEGNTVYLNKGEGMFINSGELHSGVSAKKGKSGFIAIVFLPECIIPEYDILYKKYIRPIIKKELALPKKLPKEVVDTAIETYNLFNSAGFGYELAIKGNIIRMLSMCIASAEKQCHVRHDNKSEIVKRVLDYIHMNYGNNITLYDLSLQAHVSKEHLCRIFNEVSELSPIVYLNRYRIMQTAYMLRNTDKTISEISSSCGFNNSSYFNKIFMRFMKCTPSEYRRNAVGLHK